jgi:hypothetical protein
MLDNFDPGHAIAGKENRRPVRVAVLGQDCLTLLRGRLVARQLEQHIRFSVLRRRGYCLTPS